MRSTRASCLALTLMVGTASGQAVVYTTVLEARSSWGDTGELTLLRPGEVAFCSLADPAALPFLSAPAQWAFLGDANFDGVHVPSATAGPCGRIDAIDFSLAPNGTPGELLISAANPSGFGPEVTDGAVFRYRGPGAGLDVYLPEWMLSVALCNQGFANVNLDAFCRTPGGDLLFSLADPISIPVLGTTAEPGDLLYLPAGAFLTGPGGELLAVTSCSVVIAARRADFQAWADNSGMHDSLGARPFFDDLTALALDPAGGVFPAPGLPALMLPHLWFAWGNGTNDGAILSTQSNGSLAQLGGFALARASGTTGRHLGLEAPPEGIGGLSALTLAPTSAALPVAESKNGMVAAPVGLTDVIEIGNLTPGGWVALLVTLGPGSPGSALDQFSLPGIAGIGLFGSPAGTSILAVVHASGTGFAGLSLAWQGVVPSGVHAAIQPLDIASRRAGLPALLVFP